MILKTISLFAASLATSLYCTAQSKSNQQGILIKNGTNIRLGDIMVLNKRSGDRALSNTWGVFNVPAIAGDTLALSCNNFQQTDIVVSDFADRVIYMAPVLQLNEVTVKQYSLKSDIREVQRSYREKSVFYTGTPHYYYLFLKPMTFIYENFKSEVIEARRFNRFARRELEASAVAARFNNATIKAAVPIKDSDIEHFKLAYFPTVAQVNAWSDYDLINYIKEAFSDFKKEGGNMTNLDLKLSCCE